MKKGTLAVTIIARNEETVIEGAIQSIKKYCDEIIVLDTGSTDNTVEVAKRHTPKVFTWKDYTEWSFAEARNEASKYVDPETEWIFVLDCDERLKDGCGELLKKILVQVTDNFDEIICRTVVPRQDSPDIPALVHLAHRCYRKDKCRWEGRGHNYLTTKPDRRIVAHNIEIIHNRLLKPVANNLERNEQRLEHLTTVLKKTIEKEPAHPRSYFYLGNTYRDYKYYKEAIDYYEQYLKISTWKEERYQAMVYMAECLYYQKEIEKAYKVLLDALEEDPCRCEAEYWLGRICELQLKYNQSRGWYTLSVKPMPSRALFLEGRFYTFEPHEHLCLVNYRLGRISESLENAKKVLEYLPKNERAKQNVQVLSKKIEEMKKQNISQ